MTMDYGHTTLRSIWRALAAQTGPEEAARVDRIIHALDNPTPEERERGKRTMDRVRTILRDAGLMQEAPTAPEQPGATAHTRHAERALAILMEASERSREVARAQGQCTPPPDDSTPNGSC